MSWILPPISIFPEVQIMMNVLSPVMIQMMINIPGRAMSEMKSRGKILFWTWGSNKKICEKGA